ncbi:hypothetical protein [Phormidesmis priestleyi]|uniref:hypothetical protein n=1 Tax=Phormidesmis priestleyi TaxID=268141 RepID=UPI000A8303A1|nr:hypothetical protein [Phormidesmis priestleyi]
MIYTHVLNRGERCVRSPLDARRTISFAKAEGNASQFPKGVTAPPQKFNIPKNKKLL